MALSASALWTENLYEHRQVLEVVESIAPSVKTATELLVQALSQGGKILLCGNGGSAFVAQHLAAGFTGRFVQDRPPLAALALSSDTSALTCIGNDYSYAEVFDRQLRALAEPGDALVVISDSGNSPNVLKAASAARTLGVSVVGLLGRDGGGLKAFCDVALVVPSNSTARIQEIHIIIGHTLCGAVEQALKLPPTTLRASASLSSTVGPQAGSNYGCTGVAGQAAPKQATIGSAAELLAWREVASEKGERVVMTNGCFDLLHPGHLDYLAQARELGDRLVVAVNEDESVQRLKGATRPVNSLAVRQQMLAGLAAVDYVVSFAEDTPESLYAKVLPDVLVKGGDYCAEDVAGGAAVRAAGGKVIILPFLSGHSSTGLIQRIQNMPKA